MKLKKEIKEMLRKVVFLDKDLVTLGKYIKKEIDNLNADILERLDTIEERLNKLSVEESDEDYDIEEDDEFSMFDDEVEDEPVEAEEEETEEDYDPDLDLDENERKQIEKFEPEIPPEPKPVKKVVKDTKIKIKKPNVVND